MTVLFTTDDYATIPELVAAQSGNADDVEYQLLTSISAGDITGFANGLRIFTTNDSSISGNLTSMTDGLLTLNVNVFGNVLGDNILAQNMYADSYAFNSGAEFDPFTADNIILTGSSLIERSMNTAIKDARVRDVALHLGFSGLIINHGVGGNHIAENTAYWINTIRNESTTNEGSMAILVNNGNDISANRPYSSDSSANTGLSSQLAQDFTDRYNAANSDVGLVVPTNTTFRAYTDAPTVDVFDLPSTENNGSLPYNVNIFEPLIEQLSPMFYESGAARINNYEQTLNSPWVVQRNDGVHFVEDLAHCFAEQIFLNLKRVYSDEYADVSGKTVIVYPQSISDTLSAPSGLTPLQLVNAKVIDTENNPVNNISVQFVGGSIPTDNGDGASGNSRVSNSALHGDLLLGTTVFARGVNTGNNSTSLSVGLLVSGLQPGQEVLWTMAACRSASNTTDRSGSITVNGALIGSQDAANNATSNQISALINADSEGKIEIISTPNSDSGFSYFGASEFIFT